MKIKIKTQDNFILDAEFNQVKGSKKGLILAHGMSANKYEEGIFVRAEPILNKLGYSTIRFDFRAHGQSSGNSINDFCVSGQLKDLDAVFRFMESKGSNWIGLLGASFGGSTSAIFAGKNSEKVKKLLLAYPVLDYNDVFLNPTSPWGIKDFSGYKQKLNNQGYVEVASSRYKVGKIFFDEIKKYNPCEELMKYKNPLLIIHGDNDDMVSHQGTKNCYNAQTNKNVKFVTIKGGMHGFHEEPFETQVVSLIIDFFK